VKGHLSAISTGLDCTWALSLFLLFRDCWRWRGVEELLHHAKVMEKTNTSSLRRLWKYIVGILFNSGDEAAKSSIGILRSLKTGEELGKSAAALTKARDQLRLCMNVWGNLLPGRQRRYTTRYEWSLK
jgi:hypothetical protein